MGRPLPRNQIIVTQCESYFSPAFCDKAATGGPIQVVKVVALLAMTILDKQDEHKEESINFCRDFLYTHFLT